MADSHNKSDKKIVVREEWRQKLPARPVGLRASAPTYKKPAFVAIYSLSKRH